MHVRSSTLFEFVQHFLRLHHCTSCGQLMLVQCEQSNWNDWVTHEKEAKTWRCKQTLWSGNLLLIISRLFASRSESLDLKSNFLHMHIHLSWSSIKHGLLELWICIRKHSSSRLLNVNTDYSINSPVVLKSNVAQKNLQRSHMSPCEIIFADSLQDVQGDVKSPQQSEQLHQQVDDKPAVVPLSHTVPDPGTVVVEAANAVFTRLTVPRSHGLLLETKRQVEEEEKIVVAHSYNKVSGLSQ